MSKSLYSFSEVVVRKVLDADFQTKMESVGFSTTPREVITLKHMECYGDRMIFEEEFNTILKDVSDGHLSLDDISNTIEEEVGLNYDELKVE